MESILAKIKKNCGNLTTGICEFGFSVGVKRYFYYEMFIRYGKCRDKYINLVYNFFDFFFQDQINQYSNAIVDDTVSEDSKDIWVCWWQGYDVMPELCNMCFINLQKNIPNGYTIHLVTKDNYRQYVEIPQHIFDRLDAGVLTVTQFSDILREALLYFQGGLWIDSSVWTTADFYRYIKTDMNFCSIRLDHIYKNYIIGQAISECKWSGFFMYAKKGNLVTKFAFDCMCAYYKRYIGTIDYFIQNFIIKIGYDNVPAIKKLIDSIPLSNSHLYSLFLCLNDPFDKKKWDEMCADTGVFKLSQKAKYRDEVDGKMTFYGYLRKLHAENIKL